MVYLRPNLFHYDATYIAEQDVQFPPFMRNWEIGTDCEDNTVHFPIIWQMTIEDFQTTLDQLETLS